MRTITTYPCSWEELQFCLNRHFHQDQIVLQSLCQPPVSGDNFSTTENATASFGQFVQPVLLISLPQPGLYQRGEWQQMLNGLVSPTRTETVRLNPARIIEIKSMQR